MPRIILATRNQDKIIEIRKLMQITQMELVGINSFPQAPEVIEDGDTLHANAVKKARSAFEATGIPAVADDSGLEVDALDGAPGVYSSRFAGEHVTYADNNAKLLQMLRDVPVEKRTARFRCTACFIDGEHVHYIDGVCEGRILTELRGTQGFGYDPLFYLPDFDQTFAEISIEAKNQISHRGHAFRQMGDYLRSYYHLK